MLLFGLLGVVVVGLGAEPIGLGAELIGDGGCVYNNSGCGLIFVIECSEIRFILVMASAGTSVTVFSTIFSYG